MNHTAQTSNPTTDRRVFATPHLNDPEFAASAEPFTVAPNLPVLVSFRTWCWNDGVPTESAHLLTVDETRRLAVMLLEVAGHAGGQPLQLAATHTDQGRHMHLVDGRSH